MSDPVLIGIDWGSSSFRAFLVDARGAVLARIATRDGVLAVPPGGFDATLVRLLGAWFEAHPRLPVLASGMVGSRQGWHEVAYFLCPVSPRALAGALLPVLSSSGRIVNLVPGLCARDRRGLPDVLRGEEVQVIGALDEFPNARLLCLPGTHSKWVRIRAGIIESFTTFMTGELFAVLKDHSILGRLAVEAAEDEAAFSRGAEIGLAAEPERGGTLRRLFFARSLALADELAPEAVASFLSGLLVGCEIREATGIVGAEDEVVLVGEPELCRRWERVLVLAGRSCAIASSEAAARGQLRLARLAGLLGKGSA
ncbi:MAG: 2-dehydro-3-deoxygalactonokinase [Geminicoccaceae bacterium]|nr:2-dehydro-3-deoxygalactonokinase [Geminicoccaceae bacterium]MDW8123272.1 2-dehydro-3-deoxygalactonokinase [Geminicoccaceae bacterium]